MNKERWKGLYLQESVLYVTEGGGMTSSLPRCSVQRIPDHIVVQAPCS